MYIKRREEAEIAYEIAEETLNEREYDCKQLKTAISTLENYLEWSPARDQIQEELDLALEFAEKERYNCECELTKADNFLRSINKTFGELPSTT